MGNEHFEQIARVIRTGNEAVMTGIELGREESAARIGKLEMANDNALEVLRQIIADLPTNRDWLSPDLEREAKELIKEAEE